MTNVLSELLLHDVHETKESEGFVASVSFHLELKVVGPFQST